MDVQYLNLDRRPDRNERFLAQNVPAARFHRIAAIDGRLLQRDQLAAQRLIELPLTSYSPGALGNALTHKKLWEQIATGTSPVTIAEDDAVFKHHFSDRVPSILSQLQPDWDIILWGWNFDSILHVETPGVFNQAVMRFIQPKLGAGIARFQQDQSQSIPLRLIGAFGTPCYTVSPAGARRLADRCFPLTQEMLNIPGLERLIVNCGIDVAMNKHYPQIQAYAAYPPLVWTENNFADSDSDRLRGRFRIFYETR